MVHGYHVIFVTYGAWLPNDPRGSWSDFVAAWELFRFGKVVRGAPTGSLSTDRGLAVQRSRIQRTLKYRPVQLTGKQAVAVALGFYEGAKKYGLTIWACSILPEHVHLVLARTGKSCESMTNFLKGEATKELKKQSLHPLAAFAVDGLTPQPWARKHWQVFLDSEDSIENAIAYVNDNPPNDGKRLQIWRCVSKFSGLESNVVSYPD